MLHYPSALSVSWPDSSVRGREYWTNLRGWEQCVLSVFAVSQMCKLIQIQFRTVYRNGLLTFDRISVLLFSCYMQIQIGLQPVQMCMGTVYNYPQQKLSLFLSFVFLAPTWHTLFLPPDVLTVCVVRGHSLATGMHLASLQAANEFLCSQRDWHQQI